MRNKYKKGFTLLEALLAVLIIGTVLLTTVQLRNDNFEDAGTANNIRIARMLAQAKMAEVMIDRFPEDEFISETGGFGGAFSSTPQPPKRRRGKVSRASIFDTRHLRIQRSVFNRPAVHP